LATVVDRLQDANPNLVNLTQPHTPAAREQLLGRIIRPPSRDYLGIGWCPVDVFDVVCHETPPEDEEERKMLGKGVLGWDVMRLITLNKPEISTGRRRVGRDALEAQQVPGFFGRYRGCPASR
jgi:hypothetical protein